MVGIKDFGMPSCCSDCGLWHYDRDDEPICNISYEDIFDFKKRNNDCPLIEISESDDCVNREEVLQYIKRSIHDLDYDSEMVYKDIKNLPSVHPKSIIINGDMSANNTKEMLLQRGIRNDN